MNKLALSDINIRDVGTTIQLAGVLYADKERLYSVFLPGESEDGLSRVTLDLDKEGWETFIRQTDRVEVMASVLDEHGIVGKALVRKSERMIEETVRFRVFRRDHVRCRYCGSDKVALTVDHLVLWEDGGPSVDENLVSSCRKCNGARGNQPYSEWLRSNYYKKVSVGLPPAIQYLNESLVGTLDAIPRQVGHRKR